MTTSKEKYESKKLPMMPIRDLLFFPVMMTSFVEGRESSVRALEEALASDEKNVLAAWTAFGRILSATIFLATQHDASIDEPKANEIYQVGTIVNIVKALKLPDGNIYVLVEGIERGKILQVTDTKGYMQATVRVPRFTTETNQAIEANIASHCCLNGTWNIIGSERESDEARILSGLLQNDELGLGGR